MSSGVDGRLIGRGEQIARLASLLRSHAMVCVVGPLGIGKTALVREVVERESRAGAIPSAAWLSLAGAADERALLERTARALGRERPVSSRAAIASTLERMLATSPRTVVWDDAQEADADAVDRLVGALELPSGSSRLLILSRRPIEHAALPLLHVPPLSAADFARLIEEMERERGATLVEGLIQRAGGNPLVVRLAASSLSVDTFEEPADALRRAVVALGQTGAGALSLLMALEGLVADADLERLVPDARAVMSRLRDHGLVSAEHGPLGLSAASAAVIRQQLGPLPAQCWDGLLACAERALADAPDDADALVLACRAAAERGDVRRALALLERHSLARSGASSQALTRLLRSIASADARHAARIGVVLASEQLRWGDVDDALRTLDGVEGSGLTAESEMRMRVIRARALARSGGLSRARSELNQAAEQGPSGADDVSVKLAFTALALLRGDLQRARRDLAELAPRARAVPTLECQRALAFALSYFLEERFARAVAWARRARRAQGRVGARPSLVGAIEVLALLQLDLIDRAVALVDREVEELDLADAQESLAAEITLLYAAAVRGRRGDFAGCLEAAEGLLVTLGRRGDEITRAFLARYVARMALGLGQLDRAEALLHTARGIAAESGLAALSPLIERDAGLLAEARGDADSARARLRVAAAACPGSPLIRVDAWALDAANGEAPPCAGGRSVRAYAALRGAERALAVDSPREALEPARAAEQHYRHEGAQFERARALLALAEASTRTGDFAEARVALEACEAVARPRGYAALTDALSAVRASLADRTGALGAYLDALARVMDGGRSVGDRVAAALARVGIRAPVVGRTALDATVARLGLDRRADRVLATDAETFLLADGEPLPLRSPMLINLDAQEVRAGDRATHATPQQVALLEFLCTSGGATLEEIHLRVLGGRQYDPQRHRTTVYVAIARLRGALEPVVGADANLERSDGRYRISPALHAAVLCAVDGVPPRSGLFVRLAQGTIARTLRRTPPGSGAQP